MPALPPESVARAARRWLELLKTSSCRQAWALVRSDKSYTDLTQTQYAAALDWISSLGLLQNIGEDRVLLESIASWPSERIRELVLARALESSMPLWLQDADTLVIDSEDIPQDAVLLAGELNLSSESVLSSIRQVHGRVDLERRALVGTSGELAFVRLLESCWPGSTSHLSLSDDGFGYDIAFRPGEAEWHLEVKSTTRRGRLVVHLSRHEYEVSLRDQRWRLIAVGLDSAHEVAAIGTVNHLDLQERSPTDADPSTSWQSIRAQIGVTDLLPGLPFLFSDRSVDMSAAPAVLLSGAAPGANFSWLP